MSRNKNVSSVGKPTETSIARAIEFIKEKIDKFDILEKVYDEKRFTANRIFNVDEIGLSIVESKFRKIIARHGKKQIWTITFAEKGSLVTIELSWNFRVTIFPEKNLSQILKTDAPVGYYRSSSPFWMNLDEFVHSMVSLFRWLCETNWSFTSSSFIRWSLQSHQG